jgi:hypothetical protein
MSASRNTASASTDETHPEFGELIASQVFGVKPPTPGASVEELEAYTAQVNSVMMLLSKLVFENKAATEAIEMFTQSKYEVDENGEFVVDEDGEMVIAELSPIEFTIRMLNPDFRRSYKDGLYRSFLPDHELWRGPNNALTENQPKQVEEVENKRLHREETDEAYTRRSRRIDRHYTNRVFRFLNMLTNVEQKRFRDDLTVRQRLASQSVIKAYQQVGLEVPVNIGSLILSPLAAMDRPSAVRERIVMKILDLENIVRPIDHDLIDGMSNSELQTLLRAYEGGADREDLASVEEKIAEMSDEEVINWALNRDHVVMKTVRRTKKVFDEVRGISRDEITEETVAETISGHEFYANRRLQSMGFFPRAENERTLDGETIEGQYYVDGIISYVRQELIRVLPPAMVAQKNEQYDEVFLRDEGLLYDLMRALSIDTMKKMVRTEIKECRIYHFEEPIMVDDKGRTTEDKAKWAATKSKVEADLKTRAQDQRRHMWLLNPDTETDDKWLDYVARRRSAYQKEDTTPKYTVVVTFVDDDGDDAEIVWQHTLPYVESAGGFRQTAYRRFFGDLQLILSVLVSKCMNEADQDWALPGQFQTRVWETVHQSNIAQKDERMMAAFEKYGHVLREDGSPKYEVKRTRNEVLIRRRPLDDEDETEYEWEPVRWQRNVFETFSAVLNSGQIRTYVGQLRLALDGGSSTESVPIEFQVGSVNSHIEGIKTVDLDEDYVGMVTTRGLMRGYPLAHDIVTADAVTLVKSFQDDDIVIANPPHNETLIQKFADSVVRAYGRGFKGFVFFLLPTNATWRVKPIIQQFWRNEWEDTAGLIHTSTIFPHVIHTLPLPKDHTLEIGDVSTNPLAEGSNTLYVLGPIGHPVTEELSKIISMAPASREVRQLRQKESSEKKELRGGVDSLSDKHGPGGGYTQRGRKIQVVKGRDESAADEARRKEATLEKKDSSWSAQKKAAAAKAAAIDEEGFTTKTKRRR